MNKTNPKESRKSQITLFLIFIILILFIVGLFYYIVKLNYPLVIKKVNIQLS